MKRTTITVAIIVFISFACKKKKNDYCWNQSVYNNSVIYEWDSKTPPSNKVQKFEDSCHCKTTTSTKCVPCEGMHTDINGNDFSCN